MHTRSLPNPESKPRFAGVMGTVEVGVDVDVDASLVVISSCLDARVEPVTFAFTE